MSELTPEAALRVSAEHLSKMHGASDTVLILIAEADRLEAAAKTPGQVLAETLGHAWSAMSPHLQRFHEDAAAAVIAYHVGPDRVVVERFAAMIAADKLDPRRWSATVAEFRKALS